MAQQPSGIDRAAVVDIGCQLRLRAFGGLRLGRLRDIKPRTRARNQHARGDQFVIRMHNRKTTHRQFIGQRPHRRHARTGRIKAQSHALIEPSDDLVNFIKPRIELRAG